MHGVARWVLWTNHGADGLGYGSANARRCNLRLVLKFAGNSALVDTVMGNSPLSAARNRRYTWQTVHPIKLATFIKKMQSDRNVRSRLWQVW